MATPSPPQSSFNQQDADQLVPANHNNQKSSKKERRLTSSSCDGPPREVTELPKIMPSGKIRSAQIDAVFAALKKKQKPRRSRNFQAPFEPFDARTLEHHTAMKDYWLRKKNEYQLEEESKTSFMKDYWLMDHKQPAEVYDTGVSVVRIGSIEVRGAIPSVVLPTHLTLRLPHNIGATPRQLVQPPTEYKRTTVTQSSYTLPKILPLDTIRASFEYTNSDSPLVDLGSTSSRPAVDVPRRSALGVPRIAAATSLSSRLLPAIGKAMPRDVKCAVNSVSGLERCRSGLEPWATRQTDDHYYPTKF
mmetsp:Transcript_20918/g.35035  ORF Transcript_20918/g.35035 Transcript_20918/m.35035 type:complete len:304 (-) Transcript_20918:13-924(-)